MLLMSGTQKSAFLTFLVASSEFLLLIFVPSNTEVYCSFHGALGKAAERHEEIGYNLTLQNLDVFEMID